MAFLLATLTGGGAERVVLKLAGAFAARGIAVDLLALHAHGELASAVPDGVRLIELKARTTLGALPDLVAYLRTESPEVLLSTNPHTNILAVLARRRGGRPVRLVLRASTVLEDIRQSRWMRARFLPVAMRWAYPRADAVVALCRASADELVDVIGVPAAKVALIANPVLDSAFEHQLAEPPAHPWLRDGGPPVVLGVGRLEAQKDFGTLVDAVAAVRRMRPCRLLLLGEGPERAALEAQVARNGLGKDDVSMPGFVANPIAAMASADVFVLPSLWEGLPNALIEALGTGVPVIATTGPGGSREVLQEGRWGSLVPPGNAAALAAEIGRILARPPTPRVRSPRAADFASDAIIRQYLEVLGLPDQAGD
jgi:glycosyltransferase involved in cell wall biosynthesis